MFLSDEYKREYVTILTYVNANCMKSKEEDSTYLFLILEVEFVGIDTIVDC